MVMLYFEEQFHAKIEVLTLLIGALTESFWEEYSVALFLTGIVLLGVILFTISFLVVKWKISQRADYEEIPEENKTIL
jgi:hypothetical protein